MKVWSEGEITVRCKIRTNRPGFTLTELAVTVAAATIVMLGTGVVLVDSQRGWTKMYNRAYGGVTVDAYVAKRAFDAVVRKASVKSVRIADAEAELYYYADPDTSTYFDRYARFYLNNAGEFQVDYGDLDASGDPSGTPTTVTLAKDVEAVDFLVAGAAVQMILRIDDGSQSITVVSSAVRHNE